MDTQPLHRVVRAPALRAPADLPSVWGIPCALEPARELTAWSFRAPSARTTDSIAMMKASYQQLSVTLFRRVGAH